MVELTKEELKKRFIQYNKDYFDGQLKMCRFTIMRWRSQPNGHYWGGKRPMIGISDKVDWTDQSLKIVLIHEMIHYYVCSIVHYDGFFAHGKSFKRKAKEIKKKYGIDILNAPYNIRRYEKPPKTLLERIQWFINHFEIKN